MQNIIDQIIESVLKYSFGIKILWNLNCRNSLNVLYTAYSPLNSIRFWTVIRSHNLAALLSLSTVSSQYKLQTQPGPCVQPPAAPGFRSHMSAATGGHWPEKTVHWTDCGLTGLGLGPSDELARLLVIRGLRPGQCGQGTGLQTNNPCLHLPDNCSNDQVSINIEETNISCMKFSWGV